MKKLFMLQFIFSTGILFAQTNDSTEALKYFPLENGNYWEFEHTYGDYPNGTFTSYYWMKVIGDTIFTNGKSYKIIEQWNSIFNSLGYIYERVDTTTLNVYKIYNNKEYLRCNLLVHAGDTIMCSYFEPSLSELGYCRTICLSEGEELFLGEYRSVKKMKDITTSMNTEFKLIKGLGFSFSESFELIYQCNNLIYANINGTEYGNPLVSNEDFEKPNDFCVFQNYPNPFNPSTKIRYEIPNETNVIIKVYDILGREIMTLVNSDEKAGQHETEWNAKNFSSGIYFYQIRAGEFVSTKKMLLIK